MCTDHGLYISNGKVYWNSYIHWKKAHGSRNSAQCFCHPFIETRKNTIICICSSLLYCLVNSLSVWYQRFFLCMSKSISPIKKIIVHFISNDIPFAVNIYCTDKKNIDEYFWQLKKTEKGYIFETFKDRIRWRTPWQLFV